MLRLFHILSWNTDSLFRPDNTPWWCKGKDLCSSALHVFFLKINTFSVFDFNFEQYQATGRGFVVRHIKFAENYRLYSRSHFVKGFVVLISSIFEISDLMKTFMMRISQYVGLKWFFCWWYTLHMGMRNGGLYPTFLSPSAVGLWQSLGFLLPICLTRQGLSGRSECNLYFL